MRVIIRSEGILSEHFKILVQEVFHVSDYHFQNRSFRPYEGIVYQVEEILDYGYTDRGLDKVMCRTIQDTFPDFTYDDDIIYLRGY